MLQGTVRQIKITPKLILHQNAKFSTRQYFRLYGTLPHATPIFPTKFAIIEVYKAVCTNAVTIVDTPICNCLIVSFFQNILTLKFWIFDSSMIVPNLHPSDLRWNTYRSLPGSSAITALCLSQLDLHLWAVIN